MHSLDIINLDFEDRQKLGLIESGRPRMCGWIDVVSGDYRRISSVVKPDFKHMASVL
jgi:hypothetical protein